MPSLNSSGKVKRNDPTLKIRSPPFARRSKLATRQDTEPLSKTGVGDTAILAPLMDALVEPTDERMIIVEVGANLAERVALALKSISSMK